MGINLSSITLDRATVPLEFGGQTASLVYRPNAVTRQAMETMDAQPDGDFLFLVSTLIEWDVTKGKKKVPITVESLKELPLSFIRACVYAVLGDRGDSVGEAEGNSNAG